MAKKAAHHKKEHMMHEEHSKRSAGVAHKEKEGHIGKKASHKKEHHKK